MIIASLFMIASGYWLILFTFHNTHWFYHSKRLWKRLLPMFGSKQFDRYIHLSTISWIRLRVHTVVRVMDENFGSETRKQNIQRKALWRHLLASCDLRCLEVRSCRILCLLSTLTLSLENLRLWNQSLAKCKSWAQLHQLFLGSQNEEHRDTSLDINPSPTILGLLEPSVW